MSLKSKLITGCVATAMLFGGFSMLSDTLNRETQYNSNPLIVESRRIEQVIENSPDIDSLVEAETAHREYIKRPEVKKIIEEYNNFESSSKATIPLSLFLIMGCAYPIVWTAIDSKKVAGLY